VEKAEDYLFDLGVNQCRVRDHEDTARIEVSGDDLHIILKHRDDIVGVFKELVIPISPLTWRASGAAVLISLLKTGTWDE